MMLADSAEDKSMIASIFEMSFSCQKSGKRTEWMAKMPGRAWIGLGRTPQQAAANLRVQIKRSKAHRS